MKRWLVLGVLPCLIAIPAQAMDVATFLAKADALKAQGILALMSPDLKLLQAEMKTANDAYRAGLDADAKAGRRPRSCPPPRGTVKLSSDEILADFQAIPPARRGMSVTDAMAAMMDRRFPCRG